MPTTQANIDRNQLSQGDIDRINEQAAAFDRGVNAGDYAFHYETQAAAELYTKACDYAELHGDLFPEAVRDGFIVGFAANFDLEVDFVDEESSEHILDARKRSQLYTRVNFDVSP